MKMEKLKLDDAVLRHIKSLTERLQQHVLGWENGSIPNAFDENKEAVFVASSSLNLYIYSDSAYRLIVRPFRHEFDEFEQELFMSLRANLTSSCADSIEHYYDVKAEGIDRIIVDSLFHTVELGFLSGYILSDYIGLKVFLLHWAAVHLRLKHNEN